MKRAGKRRPRKNRYTHIVFGLAVVAVIVFIFTRDDSDLPEPTPTTSPPTTVATTQTTKVATATTPPTTTTAAAEPAASAASTTSTAAPQEVTQVLNQVTVAYVEGLIGFKDSMTELVSELTAANLAWDDRDATGVSFRETASALADIVDRTRALAESVTDHPVPSVLEDLHRGPLGPVEQAAGLVPSAEAVLEGLRIPAPDDGSTRRAALADFNAAAEEFGRSVDELTRHVEENVGALGVTVPASTTTPTSTTQPPRELSDEAVAYIEGLTRFKEVLAELAAEGNAASQAWDNKAETGAPYRATAAALRGMIDQARAFGEQVRGHPVPGPIGPLGEGPIEQAARLAPLAEAVLEGLRIPAPEDGSVRRAALADFNAAAEAFANSVDILISHIDENAVSLGLVKGT